jgi:endonuclease YncB( thermonuclease family)
MKQPQNPERYRATVERFCDGDTCICLVELGLDTFRRERVRLVDLDSWELGTPDDARARRAGQLLTERLAGQPVSLVLNTRGRDRYGRLRARLYRAGENIAEEAIRLGVAWRATRGTDRTRFGAAPPPDELAPPPQGNSPC